MIMQRISHPFEDGFRHKFSAGCKDLLLGAWTIIQKISDNFSLLRYYATKVDFCRHWKDIFSNFQYIIGVLTVKFIIVQ